MGTLSRFIVIRLEKERFRKLESRRISRSQQKRFDVSSYPLGRCCSVVARMMKGEGVDLELRKNFVCFFTSSIRFFELSLNPRSTVSRRLI